jgi:hypothetical protein
MKNRKPLLILGIILSATATSLLVINPVGIRTVDFVKILALGVGVGVLLTQLTKRKG